MDFLKSLQQFIGRIKLTDFLKSLQKFIGRSRKIRLKNSSSEKLYTEEINKLFKFTDYGKF